MSKRQLQELGRVLAWLRRQSAASFIRELKRAWKRKENRRKRGRPRRYYNG